VADIERVTASPGEAMAAMFTVRRVVHRAAATALPAVTQVRREAVVDQVVGVEVAEVGGRGPAAVAPGVLPVTPVGRGAESPEGTATAPALSQPCHGVLTLWLQ